MITDGARRKGEAVAFVWENFGPSHVERCEAAAVRLVGRYRIVGIELTAQSATYHWEPESGSNFEKITLFNDCKLEKLGLWEWVFRVVKVCAAVRARHVFLCHYEYVATLVVAVLLRLMGRRVYLMNDSKFDDYPRRLIREVLKSIYNLPYNGGLAGGARAADYMRYHGRRPELITTGYDARSIARIRQMAAIAPAPDGCPFGDRHFSVVARFVPKKNLGVAIAAYDIYRRSVDRPRPLHLYGSGDLEPELREQVMAAGLQELVQFFGFVQTKEISKALGTTLALMLPSTEEQFGIVVIEALAMGVPVILSENCGARDMLMRTGQNGFIVEPDNPEGFAFFMRLLSENEPLWRDMSEAANRSAWNCDSARFAESVDHLISSAR